MNHRSWLVLYAALVLALSSNVAVRAADILDIQPSGAGLGSFDTVLIDNTNRTLEFNKSFATLGPVVLTFTMKGGTGGGPFQFLEDILNDSGADWLDFHFDIVEPHSGNGVVFSSGQVDLIDFQLDSRHPQKLNFVGSLQDGQTTTARFAISIPDPGTDHTFTFQLVQTPTIPEAGTWAMIVAGLLGVMRLASRRV